MESSFAIIAEPNRRTILSLLASSERSVGEIERRLLESVRMRMISDVPLGVNLTGGFFQYLIPTAADVPDIEAVVLESGEGLGPFGARGIGEPPIGPPLAAISSAIADAVGARPTTLPITPERVLDCVRRGREQRDAGPGPAGAL